MFYFMGSIMNKVDLSVIIPFYKGNQRINYLMACLKRNQDRSKKAFREVLVINDSPSEVIHIADIYQKALNIKVIVNPQNYGIHKSRVQGLKMATGSYVLMIDQDDLLIDDALDNIIYEMQKKKFDMYMFNAYHRVYDGGKFTDTWNIPKGFPKAFVTSLYTQIIIGNQIVSPGQVVIRRKAIPREWYENILSTNGSDDYLLWLMMFRKSYNVIYIEEPIYYHVEDGFNFSADFTKMLQSDYAVLKILKDKHLLTRCQLFFFTRKNNYNKLRNYRSLNGNIRAVIKYPDILLCRLIFKAISTILRIRQ